MSYQRKHNAFQQWQKHCQNYEELTNTSSIPKWVFLREQNFRAFATMGQIDEENTIPDYFDTLDEETFWKLFDFINVYFEIDLILFDKFEAARKNRLF